MGQGQAVLDESGPGHMDQDGLGRLDNSSSSSVGLC